MRKQKTHILFLEKDDPEKEMEFEIEFRRSLSERQRYEIMDRLVKEGLEFVRRYGYKNTPATITRSRS